MDWASIVRHVRERQGLKQAAFAHLLDVDQATVSRWERNRQVPCLSVRKKLTLIIAQMDPKPDVAQVNVRPDIQPRIVSQETYAILLAEIKDARALAEKLTAHLAGDMAMAQILNTKLDSVEDSMAKKPSSAARPIPGRKPGQG
jgi:transcriptional regulator with XRE-family HTH domain